MQASCDHVQVALGRDHSSMQSVGKTSLHLGDIEAEPSSFVSTSLQPLGSLEQAQHAARNKSVETDKRLQGGRVGVDDTPAAEPQPEVLQQCDALQVYCSARQHCVVT